MDELLLLNRAETLRSLRISEWSLRRLIEAGRLKPVYTTAGRGKTMFRTTDVQALIEGGGAACLAKGG